MPRRSLLIGSCLSASLFLSGPVRADDLQRLFGTIAGEIVREQMRQQRAQPQRQQQRQQPQRQQTTGRKAAPERDRAPRQAAAPQPGQPALSLEDRMAVQRALAAGGHYAGAIDGALGPASRRAIADWQAALGAPATGYLLDQQARALVSMAQALAPDAGAAPDPSARGLSAAGEPPLPAQAGAMPLAVTAAPLPAAPAGPPTAPDIAPPADAIRGDTALLGRLAIWTAAQDPARLDGLGMAQMLESSDLVPDLAVRKIRDPGLRREALRAALPSPDAPPPARAILERDIRIQPAWNGEPARLVTEYPEIDGVPTLTEVAVRAGGPGGRAGWTLKSAQPFFLPPPEGFEAWAPPREEQTKDRLLLQIDVDLSDPQPEITPYDNWYRGGSAAARINRVTLIRRPAPPRRATDPARPDEVLHVWTGEAPAAPAPERPADAAAVAALYGGAASDGRYVVHPHQAGIAFDDTQRPILSGDWGLDEGALAMALALRRVVQGTPDRLPDVALTERLSQQYLTARQRLDLFPPDIARRDPSAKISELTRHAAMTKAAAAVRDIAVTRAPDLPLALRWVGEAYLGEYDFATGGFPVELGPVFHHLPLAAQGPDTPLGTTIDMDPEAAQALLDRMIRANPVGGEGRQVFVAVDYTLDEMVPRASGQGPITAAELGTLSPRSRIEAAALYIDPALTDRLADLPVPEPAQAPAATDVGPGKALFATTGLSLWGAFVRADATGGMTAAVLQDLPQFHSRGTAGREARNAAMADRMRQAALDRYWVGMRFTPGEYDAATERLQIGNLQFRPVPYDNDITGIEPPPLVPADPDALSAIRVTPDEAAAIAAVADGARGIAAYALLRPAGATDQSGEGHGYALTVAPPDRLLIGPDRGDGIPETVALQVEPRTQAAKAPAVPAGDPVPPETLLLDGEGVDLLALSVDPQILDEAGWSRMLLERLMRERWHAMGDDAARGPLPWGAFFADPALTPDAGGVRALLPPFRAWTDKRVAALPAQVAVPWGEVPQGIPNCKGARDVLAGDIAGPDSALIAHAPALAGTDAAPAPGPMDYSDRPRPGGDRLFAHDSAPRHQFCRYPRQVGADTLAGLIPRGAGHVSALVGARGVPNPGPAAQQALGTLLVLRRDRLRLAPVDGLADAPDGLRAVLVLSGPVERVTAWRRSPDGRGHEIALDLTPPDWALAQAPPLAASDVVGLTLGMPLADFAAAARAHLGEAVLFTEETPGQGMFGHAQGFLNPATGEALAAVYAPGAEDQPVVAILRRLPLPPGEPAPEALKQSLTGKYGPISREVHDTAWLWGTLGDEDGWGVCGGDALLGRPERRHAPVLTPAEPLDQRPGSDHNRPEFWVEGGWPEIVADRPGQIDPARCGPVLGAMVTGGAGGRLLQVWLVDRKRAGELDAPPAPPAAADIKL